MGYGGQHKVNIMSTRGNQIYKSTWTENNSLVSFLPTFCEAVRKFILVEDCKFQRKDGFQ